MVFPHWKGSRKKRGRDRGGGNPLFWTKNKKGESPFRWGPISVPRIWRKSPEALFLKGGLEQNTRVIFGTRKREGPCGGSPGGCARTHQGGGFVSFFFFLYSLSFLCFSPWWRTDLSTLTCMLACPHSRHF